MGYFDRLTWRLREALRTDDLNGAFSKLTSQLRAYAQHMTGHSLLSGDAVSEVSAPVGFLGGSFLVVPSSGMDVSVRPGVALLAPGAASDILGSIYPSVNGDAVRAIEMSQALTLTIDAFPGGGNGRIDIIEVRHLTTVTSVTREVWNAANRAFAATTVSKWLGFDGYASNQRVVHPAAGTASLVYRVGVTAPSGSEVLPATSSGYTKVAEIRLSGAGTVVPSTAIADCRDHLHPGGASAIGAACTLYTDDTSGTPPALLSHHAPPGIRIAVSGDESNTNTGEAAFLVFVSHGQNERADVTFNVVNGEAVPVTVTAANVSVGGLTPSNAGKLNGTTAGWSDAFNHGLAAGQYGTLYSVKAVRSGAWSVAPELWITGTVGRVA